MIEVRGQTFACYLVHPKSEMISVTSYVGHICDTAQIGHLHSNPCIPCVKQMWTSWC